MSFIILFLFCFLCGNHTAIAGKCISPPMKCPNENVTFWLYTRNNSDKPHELFANDPHSIKKAPWVIDAPIKVLIHGYTGDKDFSPNTEIRPAYMECCDYNIISVDYNPIAREPCYFESARNTELVGMCTAELIDVLVKNYDFPVKQFHVIGFSLGAQVAGYIAVYLKVGPLSRISALDPALPLFVTNDINKKIDKSDALFVDVLHTNSLEKGKLESCGDADFYANGGILQPGCRFTRNQSMSSCNHARAPIYYAESITSTVGFHATKCYSWIIFMIGWCESLTSEEAVLYGEHVSHDIQGLYFFSTNPKSPHARGKDGGNTKRSIFFPFIR